MIIEYHPTVSDELEEIRDYYEDKSTGLGLDFVNEKHEKRHPAFGLSRQ
jgi:hypothetical protein